MWTIVFGGLVEILSYYVSKVNVLTLTQKVKFLEGDRKVAVLVAGAAEFDEDKAL